MRPHARRLELFLFVSVYDQANNSTQPQHISTAHSHSTQPQHTATAHSHSTQRTLHADRSLASIVVVPVAGQHPLRYVNFGNFDIDFGDHLSPFPQSYHPKSCVSCSKRLMPMFIGCRLVLAIQWHAQLTLLTWACNATTCPIGACNTMTWLMFLVLFLVLQVPQSIRWATRPRSRPRQVAFCRISHRFRCAKLGSARAFPTVSAALSWALRAHFLAGGWHRLI